jgi:hypothetical protein
VHEDLQCLRRYEGEAIMVEAKPGIGQRWSAARPTKTTVFWAVMASMVFTMIIGFTWGGWVTGGTAKKMAEAGGEEAVAKRLGLMCVVQFKLDGQKVQKLKGLKETGTWEQTEYVKKQGWATMPGEKEADSKVADECVKLLMLMS